MRRLFAAVIATSTLLGAAAAAPTPASAQPWGYWGGPYHHPYWGPRPYWGPHPYWGPRPYWGAYRGWGYRPYWRGYRPYRRPYGYGWRRW